MESANICHGCLSIDRRLTLLEEHAKLYHQLLLKKSSNKTKMLLMCWECQKMLNNIHTFRMRITQAQKLLNISTPKVHKALSNLTETKQIDEYQKIIYEDEKINRIPEFNIEIKHEVQEDSEENYDYVDDNVITNELKNEFKEEDKDFDNFDKNDDCDNIDVKDEIHSDQVLVPIDLPEKKKEKGKGKKKHVVFKKKYRIIKMANIPDKRRFYNIEKIDLKTVEEWMAKKKDPVRRMKIQCPRCYSCFPQQSLYDHHCAVRHNEKHKYVCDICGYRYATLSTLRLHVAHHFVQFRCTLCSRAFPTRTAIHMHFTHGPHGRQKECIKCNMRFDCSKSSEFSNHYKTMHGRKICDYCGAGWTRKSMLARHIQHRHTRYRCKLCNIDLRDIFTYKAHCDRKHVVDTSERNYCVECDIQFANSHLYKEHINRSVKHRTKPRVPCPDCSKTYSKRSYMLNHFNMEHLKKTKHHCSICNRYFLTSYTLRNHQMYTHEKLPKNGESRLDSVLAKQDSPRRCPDEPHFGQPRAHTHGRTTVRVYAVYGCVCAVHRPARAYAFHA